KGCSCRSRWGRPKRTSRRLGRRKRASEAPVWQGRNRKRAHALRCSPRHRLTNRVGQLRDVEKGPRKLDAPFAEFHGELQGFGRLKACAGKESEVAEDGRGRALGDDLALLQQHNAIGP